MKKYENGERRVYKRIDIMYDADGRYVYGCFEACHWYIELTTLFLIGNNPPGKRKTRVTREYFRTIAEAKRYIDDFEK